MTLILDSGGLLAAMDPNQNDHEAVRQALESAPGPLIISPFVVAELDYMILRDYGREDQLTFLDEVDRGAYQLEPFADADFSRARKLMNDYDYLRGFGIADASNVVLAERYGTRDILTTDQKTSAASSSPAGGTSGSFPTISRPSSRATYGASS